MKAFIFDLDGTLLDTLADIGNACNHVLKLAGFEQHQLPAYRQMVGNGFAKLIERAAAPSILTPDELDRLTLRARKWYGEHMFVKTRPYPGLVKALSQLEINGVKLAVLSNKPDNLTVKLISHYFPSVPFLAIQGSREDMPLKPNPQALLKIIELAKCGLNDCCYIGDSNVDMETAHNAGCHAIGVAWGFRGSEELLTSGAERIICVPDELPALLI